METLTLLDLRGKFGCNRITDPFIEQDLKFESFGNLGLNYTLLTIVLGAIFLTGNRLSLAIS